jgi:hypothetical protein
LHFDDALTTAAVGNDHLGEIYRPALIFAEDDLSRISTKSSQRKETAEEKNGKSRAIQAGYSQIVFIRALLLPGVIVIDRTKSCIHIVI